MAERTAARIDRPGGHRFRRGHPCGQDTAAGLHGELVRQRPSRRTLVARDAANSGEFTSVDTADDGGAQPTSGSTGAKIAILHFRRDVLAIDNLLLHSTPWAWSTTTGEAAACLPPSWKASA